MSWNHRVCKKVHTGKYRNGEKWESSSYGIHEVYYNDDGSIFGITEVPVDVGIDVLNDDDDDDPVGSIKWTLEKMLESLEKPIIDLDTVEYNGMVKCNDDTTEGSE